MLRVQGYWFDGKTSVSLPVELQVDAVGEMCIIHRDSQQMLHHESIADVRITSRIGNTPRFIYFREGGKFETRDNQSVDTLLTLHKPSLFHTLAHQLESHTYFVLFTLIAVALITWSGIQYGLPAASNFIAQRLPQNIMKLASVETLELLDKTQLKPSTLDDNIKTRVQHHFARAIDENKNLHINVLFRDGGYLGANAFALPDGTVIFTDDMVNLAKNDDELLAVFAHEIGHVKYRHGLRSAIQSSSLGFFVSMLTGDLSAASSVITALPIILTTMSYSRNFEREADQNALKYLDAHKISRLNFVTLMERVTYESHCDMLLAITAKKDEIKNEPTEKAEVDKHDANIDHDIKSDLAKSDAEKKQPLTETQLAARKATCDKLIEEHKSDKHAVMDYFSTHPATEERLKKFRQNP